MSAGRKKEEDSRSVLDIFEKPVLADMARACDSPDASAVPLELKPFDLVLCAPSEFDALVQELSAQWEDGDFL
jgi:hypothetical protein